MNLRELKLFVEAARRGSFAAVARDQDLDPSVVSRTIAALERQVGARLFQRTKRKVVLSEAGALYLERITPLIEELDEATEEARSATQRPIGKLKLTASNAFGQTCLAPLLPTFQRAYPDLTLELELSDHHLDLVSEGIDLAIRFTTSEVKEPYQEKLFDTHFRVVASPSYLSNAGPITRPSDLSHHPCLLFNLADIRSRWLFRLGQKLPETVPVTGPLMSSNALTLLECAIAGMGPALLPHWLADTHIQQGRLISLFDEYHVTGSSSNPAAWLIYPSRSYMPAKVRIMAQFLKDRLNTISEATEF